VTGFLQQAGSMTLGDVKITSTMEYGTIHIISLDNQPLKSAKKILIQCFSEERMYDFTVDKGKIINAGRVPINVRDINATVTFANGNGLKVTSLDLNGYAVGKAVPVQGGSVNVGNHSLYTLVER
jgi:hypothetical protein